MKNVILCILDGWGHREFDHNNGLTHAKEWRRILETYPHTFINASESFVGLPDGQMGNSEVGHMTIGLGRTLDQDLPRINKAILNRTFELQPGFSELICKTKAGSNRCHVMGLFSDGGVHSHQNHFLHAVQCLKENNIEVILHPILDGRDTSPKSGLAFLPTLDDLLCETVKAGTLSGRYFTMDRDNRWDRIKSAYDVFINGSDVTKHTRFQDALATSYHNNITDEFFEPEAICDYEGVKNGDSFFIINFRADRVRQFLTALTSPTFLNMHPEFTAQPEFSYSLGMMEYSEALTPFIKPLFTKTPLTHGLGECVSSKGLKQLRIAETEKYAHVTYFFNGGVEEPFAGEDRILIPSPTVATYDLAPEMSAKAVTEKIIDAMKEKQYPLMVANYANSDMVGHTGIVDAIHIAVQTIDEILHQLEQTALDTDWTLIITADHGNVETMKSVNGAPHTAHTCNLVPFVIIDRNSNLKLRHDLATLADIAPTVLAILQLEQPSEMTGKSLVI